MFATNSTSPTWTTNCSKKYRNSNTDPVPKTMHSSIRHNTECSDFPSTPVSINPFKRKASCKSKT